MPSFLGKTFSAIARIAGNVNPIVVRQKKKNIVKDLRSMEPLFRHYFAPPGYRFEKIDVDGVPTEVFSKKKNGSDNVVLVIHGGAYISRMMFYYRLLNPLYSKASGGGTVVHYDYRCAPEHIYPAALEDTLKVWNWLLQKGYREEKIVTVGDSAGGHLTMDLLQTLRARGAKMPKASVLMSPWIDMTASGRTYVENYKVDPVFGIKGQTPGPEEVRSLLMESELYMWLGDNDRTDPMISPALADYDDGYPPIFVTVGGNEMLLSDAETLVRKFRDAGVEAHLLVGDGMMHAYPVYQLFPEAQQALRQICDFIRGQLDV